MTRLTTRTSKIDNSNIKVIIIIVPSNYNNCIRQLTLTTPIMPRVGHDGFVSPRGVTLERAGVQVSKRLASAGIM